jgi:replicative DNA helicase
VGDINVAIDKLEQLQDKWMRNKSDVWGTSTGFPSIDKYTGGFHNGEVFVIGARTSHGKTALGSQMLFSIVEEIALESIDAKETTGKVVVFSPEMSGAMLMLRQASVMSLVPSTKIRRGQASEQELQSWRSATDILREFDPYVVMRTAGDLSAQDIVTQVSTQHAKGIPIRLVVVDYLQYLTNAGGRDNTYEQVSGVTKELKDLANRLDVPVLVLSQMNRKAAQKAEDDSEDVPELHELEGSGKIEARADTVALLWRPIKISINEDDPQRALVRIGKNRNGPVGIVPLWYYPAYTRFVDPEAA